MNPAHSTRPDDRFSPFGLKWLKLLHLFKSKQVFCFENTMNTFLLRNPAVQESPAQTFLFGRSPGGESPLDLMNHFPVVHPVGASLRLFKFVPDKFVGPGSPL